jgi:hypothetical protein
MHEVKSEEQREGEKRRHVHDISRIGRTLSWGHVPEHA